MTFWEKLKATLMLRAFGLFKIPMILFVGPRVLHLDKEKCVLKIPLGYRTRNHLGGMYFGTLATGADCAGGLAAMERIKASGANVSLIFKDFHAEFLKRAEADVHFTCTDGARIAEQVDIAVKGTERVSFPVNIIATCPETFGDEPVAKFVLTLSLKRRDSK